MLLLVNVTSAQFDDLYYDADDYEGTETVTYSNDSYDDYGYDAYDDTYDDSGYDYYDEYDYSYASRINRYIGRFFQVILRSFQFQR